MTSDVSAADRLGRRRMGGLLGAQPPLATSMSTAAMSTKTTAQLELHDIQGGAVRGYTFAHSSFTFVEFQSAEGGRQWIAGMAGHVCSAAPWTGKPSSVVNVAFTAPGLRALGLPDALLGTFPLPFLQGMAARAGQIGDRGASAPEHWEPPFGSARLHAVVWIHAADVKHLAQRQAEVFAEAESNQVTIVGRQDGAVRPDRREHFGFTDGLSQPEIEGLDSQPRHGHGAVMAGGGTRPIQPGEFLLGYPTEEGVLPDAPRPSALARNATFLVYRKIYQDVAAFRRLLSEQARRLGWDEELVAAKLVGRWRDGTALALSPKAPGSGSGSGSALGSARAPGSGSGSGSGPGSAKLVRQRGSTASPSNDFSYADDPQGLRCPVGAHIRRANPRDSLPFEGKLVNRHRMIRRGMPYGPLLRPGTNDDGVDRGLIFASFQADLERQFEFIQSQWLNDGNALGLGAAKDALVGNQDGTGTMIVPGARTAFVHPLSSLVTIRAGEYFFVPGLGGLRWLANPQLP